MLIKQSQLQMKSFNRLPLRTKILIFSLAISVIPLIIIGVLSYSGSAKVINENMNEYALNITEQISDNIDNFAYQYNQKVMEISFSNALQRNYYDFVRLVNEENVSIADKITYQQQIESSFYDHIISNEYIGTIVFFPDDTGMSLAAGIQVPINDYNNVESFLMVMETTNEVTWLKNENLFEGSLEEDYFTLLYPSKNRFYNKVIGVLAITVSEKALVERYIQNISDNGLLYVLNSQGTIISSNIVNDIGLQVDETLLPMVHSASESSVAVGNKTLKGKQMHFVVTRLENVDWYVVNGLSYKFMKASNTLLLVVIWLAIVLLIISIILITNVMSKYISVPIRDMRKVMKQIGKGDFSQRLDEHYKDEFKDLSEGFNTMIDEISVLRSNEKRVYMEMGKAQFLSLQAQINPHFIYNTLETINWMANMVDSDEIALMITSLGNILRFSLDKSVTTTTVEDEIKNLNYYIRIQQVRYKNKLNIVVDVDDDIYEYRMIKFVLQPLVENSIYHAFEYFTKESQITVKGKLEGEYLVFQVIDNGIGMEASVLEKFKDDCINVEKGYGLSNVIKRIGVYYGDRGTVDIKSNLITGTQIILKISAVYEDEKWS